LLAAVLCAGIAYGKPADKTRLTSGAVVDDPSLTEAQRAQLEEECLRKEASLGITRGTTPSCMCGAPSNGISIQCLPVMNRYGYKVKGVPCYAQERSYWCGPASARQSLYWHKASSGSGTALPSQTTLASRIGTTTSGSSTAAIARAMNAYNGIFGRFYYVAADISNVGDPLGAFYDRIGGMVSSGAGSTVPIILLQTAYVTRYGGHMSRHYVSIAGINDTAVPVRMLDVDPNWNAAYRGTYWDEVGCTLHSGLCMGCFKADVAGSNLAMAW
jgi:hypothetical protein